MNRNLWCHNLWLQTSLAIPVARSFSPELTDKSTQEYKELADDVTELVRPTFVANNPIPGSELEISVSFSSSNQPKSRRQGLKNQKNLLFDSYKRFW